MPRQTPEPNKTPERRALGQPVWANRRVVICLGRGGVGKTTVSAALALAAAASGLNTLVITVDPARRLAQALGLESPSNAYLQPHQMDPALWASHGVHLLGSLWMMMPDVKQTWDTLIQRQATSAQQAHTILTHPVYQHFSNAMAGSHEYAAVEQLYDVYASGKYDVMVVDTPPSQNATAFLEAPQRILNFLDHQTWAWFLNALGSLKHVSGKGVSRRLWNLKDSFFLKHLSHVAGVETLRELADFILNFQGMYPGFQNRSQQVKALLASDETAYLWVTTPQSHPLQSHPRQRITRFEEEQIPHHIKLQSWVVNRMRPLVYAKKDAPDMQASIQKLTASLAPSVQSQIMQAVVQEAEQAFFDQDLFETLRQSLPSKAVTALPEIACDAQAAAAIACLHRYFLHADLVKGAACTR